MSSNDRTNARLNAYASTPALEHLARGAEVVAYIDLGNDYRVAIIKAEGMYVVIVHDWKNVWHSYKTPMSRTEAIKEFCELTKLEIR